MIKFLCGGSGCGFIQHFVRFSFSKPCNILFVTLSKSETVIYSYSYKQVRYKQGYRYKYNTRPYKYSTSTPRSATAYRTVRYKYRALQTAERRHVVEIILHQGE